MKYMILIYGNVEGWKSMDADSFRALMPRTAPSSRS
jgi:hypothetical protein